MENITKVLDEMGIKYTINTNPTEEQVERIRKSIEKRDIELKKVQELYKEGGIEAIDKYYEQTKRAI